MNPSSWMPFYGNDFFSATSGLDDRAQLAYLRALWHYWHHTHCDGLPDDDAYLQRICQCPLEHWARIKGSVFDGRMFFAQEGGKWHQKRARREFAGAHATYQNRVASAAAAREARNAREKQQQQQQAPAQRDEAQPLVGSRDDFPEQPNLVAVKAYADRIGLPEWKAVEWYERMESVGWVDAKGRKIVRWEPALNAVKRYWEADGRPTAATQRQPQSRGPNGVAAQVDDVTTQDIKKLRRQVERI